MGPVVRYPAFAARCPKGHLSRQEYSRHLRTAMAAGGPVFVWCPTCQDGWTPTPALEAVARAWARGDLEPPSASDSARKAPDHPGRATKAGAQA